MIEQFAYALVRWLAEGKTPAFLTLDVEGEDVLAVFQSVEDAEAHAVLRGLKPGGWSIVPGPADDLLERLRYAPPHIEYATFNPPVAVKGGPPVKINLIPLRRLVD